MTNINFARVIMEDLAPVWDISETLLDWGLRIKFGHTNNIFTWPEFKKIVEQNKANGTLDKLLAFPSSFYSWPDRSIFINLPDHTEKDARIRPCLPPPLAESNQSKFSSIHFLTSPVMGYKLSLSLVKP